MGAKSSPESLSDFLTVRAAALYLGVSASTLRNWDRDGKLEAYRHPINGYRLYNKTQLDKLLAKIVRRKWK
jgi:MerR family copper efflux transcriptional regulator